MRSFVTLIALCIGCITAANAQTFTQRLQQRKAGEGKVTVTHSKDIDNLVNGTAVTVPKDSTKAVITTEDARALLRQLDSRDTISHHTVPHPNHSTAISQDTITAPVVDTSKKIMRGGQKVMGYRVQVFAGGNQRKDRQKAERIGSEIKSLFPRQPVYVHFYSPRWICRMGNFRTYEEAVQMLSSVKSMGYNAATIIKEKITVYN